VKEAAQLGPLEKAALVSRAQLCVTGPTSPCFSSSAEIRAVSESPFL
jgi:hypothetical protein